MTEGEAMLALMETARGIGFGGFLVGDRLYAPGLELKVQGWKEVRCFLAGWCFGKAAGSAAAYNALAALQKEKEARGGE